MKKFRCIYHLQENALWFFWVLTKKISDAIDNVAPIKTLRIKNNSQDWFDSEIAEAIKLREKYFKKFKKSNLHIDYDFYIEAKYNVQKLIKQKKIEFYNAKLTENIGKPKELWRALKNLGLPSKKSPSTNICLTKDNTTIFADKENTNIFKKFYSTLADDLVKNLPPASSIFGLSSVCQYYNKTLKLPNTRFKFTFVSEDSVLKILKNIDENKAAGLDNLSGKFLKDGATILAKPLSQICNLSIKYSTFPNDCKIAKLKPLFKRGSKTDPKNYRPISLLPLISKIIEKIIHDQTQNFLDKNNVIYRYQSGFRKFYSTDSCLSYLNNKITTGFESGLFTGMILIDLQKAFDTINHDILIKKMTFLGFSEETTNWFKSYLTNRKFIVHINNSFSEPGNLLCGVPQGSILGPLLFLLYINDMPQAVTCDLLLYADDTCLVFQHKDVIEIETVLNKNFSSLCDWFIDNKLSIHFGEEKTKSILFSSKHKVKKCKPLNIHYKNIKIKQYSKVTYLGCILDETLSGESNINIFKKFYSTLADDLVKNLPPASSIFGLSSVCQYYNKTLKLPNTRFKFTFVSEDSVLKILKNIDENKAAGLDNLSGKFLKDGATILAKPLSQICNLSIKYSTFPNDCKIAKLKPLFKRGSKTDPKNYRPISLLPLISKIIEKIIHDQTQNFLDKNNVIYRYQSGFRKFYSTDSCLSYLNNKITTGFESGLFTGMILIDLQKAFDTINHDILIKKMTFLGFSEETTNWFKSYLTNRKFIVHINNSFSEPGNLLCGVPQGSILGPLLFLLYINDMPQAVTCDLLLYADDTCLVFQHKDVIEIETVLNKNFSSLCDWFIDNKLSIHFGEEKTKSILFSSKHKVKKCKPLNIHYKNIKIKQYSKVTYLGCILDETLSGESMAIHVINKINSRLRFLYRQNRYLSFPLRRLLCNAMIQPFFDYACNAWYPNINKKLKTRLQAAQNKCIRFCLKLDDRFRLKSKEFERINWLPVQERISQCAVCNVYKFFSKHSPDYFEELFFPTEETAIRTRSSFQKLKIPRRKTNIGLKSLSYTGPSLWNNLNENLKRSSSINDFKHKIKEFYFEEFKKTKHES